MAAFSVITPDIIAAIPEVPKFVAERQVLRALRDFAEESRAWRVNIELGTVASTALIDLSSLLPTGSELVDIISIKNILGGQPVLPTTFMRLDKDSNDWRTDEDLNARYYVLEGNNTIRLAPIPSTTIVTKYYARVAVKPVLATATTVDDVIANKYDQLLVHGALAKLFLLPRKPWTDANLAVYHQNLFDLGTDAARTEASEEFQTGLARAVKYGGI